MMALKTENMTVQNSGEINAESRSNVTSNATQPVQTAESKNKLDDLILKYFILTCAWVAFMATYYHLHLYFNAPKEHELVALAQKAFFVYMAISAVFALIFISFFIIQRKDGNSPKDCLVNCFCECLLIVHNVFTLIFIHIIEWKVDWNFLHLIIDISLFAVSIIVAVLVTLVVKSLIGLSIKTPKCAPGAQLTV